MCECRLKVRSHVRGNSGYAENVLRGKATDGMACTGESKLAGVFAIRGPVVGVWASCGLTVCGNPKVDRARYCVMMLVPRAFGSVDLLE
jgi:hypothetical protein